MFFAHGSYEEITLVSAATGWDPLLFQPDIVLGVPEPGILDGLQLEDTGGAAAQFSVQVYWLGTGIPAPQDFELYDANFDVMATGQTVLVPEPASALLAAVVAWQRHL